MNTFKTILILAFAFLAVFAESVFSAPRQLLGAQIDLLPALMVFAALSTNLFTVSLLATAGGLWFDSLSENPLGITILPLFTVGFLAGMRRDLILRNSTFAQFVLGATASALVPALTILLLLNSGKQPVIGWGTFWQLIVMTAGGAAATPLIFSVFAWCDHALGYQPQIETSFRPDREIQRGRNKQ